MLMREERNRIELLTSGFGARGCNPALYH